MNMTELKQQLESGNYPAIFSDIYAGEEKDQAKRYAKALDAFREAFGGGEVLVFSAPGRSEIAGNHTDHQHGEVLAASIDLDAIGIVRKKDDGKVNLISEGFPMVTIDCADLSVRSEEEGTTAGLIRGVLAGLSERGHLVGGFDAYVTSKVLIGAGLSSSAAFETLVGTIESGLYNEGLISATTIAMIGQYAENVYFGKPCGLMDQMACSVGSLVHIDFADPSDPKTEQVLFDFSAAGYRLCITDTKGSHADLTPDYAAVPAEMKAVAACFGKEVLRDVDENELMADLPAIREKCGDRAVLRAMHFYEENRRVQQDVQALRAGDMEAFLSGVRASGASSFQYLQNVYTSHDVQHQNVSLALCVAEKLLSGRGACRVHGGGFAGTMQAWVPEELVRAYQKGMDAVFGDGACAVLRVRSRGGVRVI
ncbi:MAG: galactokinase [Lachnospiraceae bacterium]|nr:galactokinase [Lachnospiraceae bacterium]